MNPNLLAAIIDGTATRVSLTFPGVVDPHGVIFFIDGGSSGKNNRTTVLCGGGFVRKNSGYNKLKTRLSYWKIVLMTTPIMKVQGLKWHGTQIV